MKIILETIIEGIASKVDGSVSIKLSTQELDASIAGQVFGLRGKFVKVLISDSNITTLEEEMVDTTKLVGGKKQKTPSSRLRAVMFRLHEQLNSTEEFDNFYINQMNVIIDHYKGKLDA